MDFGRDNAFILKAAADGKITIRGALQRNIGQQSSNLLRYGRELSMLSDYCCWRIKGFEVKNRVIRVINLTLIAFQGFVFSVHSKAEGGTESCSLPWALIAEKFSNDSGFCSSVESGNDNKQQRVYKLNESFNSELNYVFQPEGAATIKLPSGESTGNSLQKIVVSLAKWVGGAWQEVDEVSASIKSNEIRLSSEIGNEGFFRLQFSAEASDERLSNLEIFAIVCGNWKKDILAFCRELKGEIEINPDPKLMSSSIAESHIDNAMEMISDASFLSGEVLKALANAVENKEAFDNGQCPDLVVGLNKIRLKRFEGARVAEFVVFVPNEYDGSKKWPLYLHVDPYLLEANRNYTRTGMIDLWWHFPKPKSYKWKDYQHLMRMLRKKLNIDEDRIYIHGHCNNGIAAMALALHYPDQWAECNISTGNSFRHLAGNALNLPLIYNNAHPANKSLEAYIDFSVKCFEFFGCRDFKFSNTQSAAELRGAPLPEAVRERNPKRVLYTIESLHNPRAYWVKIDGREDENLNATIDASVDEQSVLVKTSNIDAYSLYLSQAPVDSNKPVEIIENGQSLGSVTGRIFTRKSEKYADAAYMKNECVHGPVWDAFTGPYAIVYGTGGKDREFCETSERIAKSLANGAPVFADANVPEELVNSHNLILVGTPASNLWLSKIYKELPVQIEQAQLTACGKRYNSRNMGLILIYPNPLKPERYTVIFTGLSSTAMSNISEAYHQMGSIQTADVGIFEITDVCDIKWHIVEKFNTVWGWHDGWDEILTVVTKKHSKWRWCQWVARVLREQLGADVVLCEVPLKFSDLALEGQITYRDIFNSFRNDWIIKVRTDGKSLRNLLSVPLNDVAKGDVNTLIVDGVSFVKAGQGPEEGALGMNELEDDEKYTVCLAYKLFYGERTGVTLLKDYEIVGEGYIVSLLKDYLYKNKNLDLDERLNRMKLNVF